MSELLGVPGSVPVGALFVVVGYLVRYRGRTELLKGDRTGDGRTAGAFFLVAGVGLLGYGVTRLVGLVP
ncbi:hypothetical protein SAMN04487947_0650 [Halogeometricum rufum]|uniref:Uncharacterized protein n=1 Tax=Halogeometricum rufum TaxID=553469 RepID=A0A1I6G710_9EURY|nr:hypothetical protein [Halogeometricum rufum]SFR37827.1 hypothetical protein SAMN04487947_0650 [Halogeometricum rufum]